MTEVKNKKPFTDELKEKLKDAMNVTEVQKIPEEIKAGRAAAQVQAADDAKLAKKASLAKILALTRKKLVKSVSAPSLSNMDEEEEEDLNMSDLSAEETAPLQSTITVPTRQSGRTKERQSYAEVDLDEEWFSYYIIINFAYLAGKALCFQRVNYGASGILREARKSWQLP
ncbi:hypothetical protein B0O99DRAFT_683642 [Bisporella sp. PMI_857]|nr:hypothetical protein B0O99DRAFT_683642 [Bisporella sp. PMI_857]